MRNIVDTVVYKDGMMLVLDKPAGWSCTPTGPGVHLTNYLQALTFGKTTLPQVAHRLDRETTGCLLLGRHPRDVFHVSGGRREEGGYALTDAGRMRRRPIRACRRSYMGAAVAGASAR